MKRFIAATIAAAILGLGLASSAAATDHTSYYKAKQCVALLGNCPAWGEANSDSDRNNEGSRLRALGWCLSSNEYARGLIDGWNHTTILWAWHTCKGYLIHVEFQFYWSSSNGWWDLTGYEIFP